MRGYGNIRLWPILAISCLCAVGLPLHAAQRLDDSASPRQVVSTIAITDGQGNPLDGMRPPTEILLHYGAIEYRLATAAYVGKQARVYFVIPPYIPGLQNPAALLAQWQGSGDFRDGSARPGTRALVWAGMVRAPWLTGALQLTYRIDPRHMQRHFGTGPGIEPYFEIETQP